MNLLCRSLLLTLLLASTARADAGASSAPPDAQTAAEAERAKWSELRRLIYLARDRSLAVRDFTCTFYRREYKGGQQPQEIAQLKFRRSPRSVYLKWIGKTRHGQEALWREGWNGGKLRAHPGSFPDFTVSLAPESGLAMRGSRHPITRADLDHAIGLVLRDLELASQDPRCARELRDLGTLTVHKAPSRCFEVALDKDACPTLFARRANICLHTGLGLPTRLQVWDREDGAERLVGDYGYEDLRVDVGLGDADFDPDNPDYDF